MDKPTKSRTLPELEPSIDNKLPTVQRMRGEWWLLCGISGQT